VSGKVVRSRTYSRLGWTRLAVVAIMILITILLASFAALAKPSRAYAAEEAASPSVPSAIPDRRFLRPASSPAECSSHYLPGHDPVTFS
jgi:hypothetical protein